jgi:hypothetical protein
MWGAVQAAQSMGNRMDVSDICPCECLSGKKRSLLHVGPRSKVVAICANLGQVLEDELYSFKRRLSRLSGV